MASASDVCKGTYPTQATPIQSAAVRLAARLAKQNAAASEEGVAADVAAALDEVGNNDSTY